jgi:hypothetical protein
MKKVLAFALPLAVLASVGPDASADLGVVNPQILRFFSTTVKGTISVPGAPGGPLNGFACGNITVNATSKDMKPPAPGSIFSSPKWTRSATATGNYASGTCSYSLAVPGGSAFYLDAGGHGNFACDVVETWVGPQGAAIGPISVPLGTAKQENFTITKVVCEIIR